MNQTFIGKKENSQSAFQQKHQHGIPRKQSIIQEITNQQSLNQDIQIQQTDETVHSAIPLQQVQQEIPNQQRFGPNMYHEQAVFRNQPVQQVLPFQQQQIFLNQANQQVFPINNEPNINQLIQPGSNVGLNQPIILNIPNQGSFANQQNQPNFVNQMNQPIPPQHPQQFLPSHPMNQGFSNQQIQSIQFNPMMQPIPSYQQCNPINEVERRIGYQFKDKKHICMALTTRSCSSQANYERYEFFGDSILFLIAAEFVCNHFPKLNENELTHLQTYLVRNITLAKFTKQMGLGAFINAVAGELVQNSKIWADIYEAIVAAIYLDGGYNEAKKFAYRSLESEIMSFDDEKLNEIWGNI
ncbi:ribonuclease III [Histomonas meleagridis]|uniref:ribonuclease III n=1 Tax=Histomonas meleagridis TaxID=135588 RepID=UPI0035598248|nr:ribonuclease III [Histomonas meleagridis]KAH0802196.1 ribonuclease III [Histomonas meleagridis]